MIIELNNAWAYITKCNKDELNWVDGYLRYQPKSFRRAGGDKLTTPAPTKLLQRGRKRFPVGFCLLLLQKAKKDGISIKFANKVVKPVIAQDANLDWLRDYQIESIKAAEKFTRGILHLSTGAGKGEIGIGLTRAFPNQKWLFIVHRKQLMHDFAKRYDTRNTEHGLDLPPAGKIGDGLWEIGPNLTCATFQTLHANRNNRYYRALVKNTTGIIVDESHTLPANSFYKCIMDFDNAAMRIGLSGTPLARGDKKSLIAIGALGPVIYTLKADVLIEQGTLAKPKITMIKVEQALSNTTWAGVYRESIVNSRVRNSAIISAAQKVKPPMLIFIKDIKHGKNLKNLAQKVGLSCEFVYGDHSQQSREAAIQRLERGHIDVLICSTIFQEGIDIPTLNSVIIGSGGKSIIATLQRLGRGMRKAKGKDTFELVDFYDVGSKSIQKHSELRRKAYQKENHDVLTLSVSEYIATQ